MRIRIVQQPTVSCIDGVQLDKFVPGQLYDVGTTFGALLLAEGWAQPVDDDSEPALVIPLRDFDSPPPEPSPSNLSREGNPPYYDGHAIALDRRHRPRKRRA